MSNLIGGGLVAKRLIYQHLAGNGLTSPQAPNAVTDVWILSTDVTPQPWYVLGVWDDAEVWNDNPEIWYD